MSWNEFEKMFGGFSSEELDLILAYAKKILACSKAEN